MKNKDISTVFRAGWKRLATVAIATAALATTSAQAAESYTFSSLAGGGVSLDVLNATGTNARFLNPTSTAVDTNGDIYVADGGDHTIRKITSAGVVTTFAGTSGEAGSVAGIGTAAKFVYPFGIAIGGDGNIYVTDIGDHTIRKINKATAAVTIWAGTAGTAGSDNGLGTAAKFNLPQGIAVSSDPYVYVADTGNSTIRRIDAAGNVVLFAGATGIIGTADDAGPSARFNYPVGVTVDTVGNIYVADFGNSSVRKITTGGNVTTFAGFSGTAGTADGDGINALFDHPSGVAVDAAGNVYVADTSNHTIRKINISRQVTTIAGSAGVSGSTEGTGSAARFFYPAGISVAADGSNILVVDTGSHKIRSISSLNATATVAGAVGTVGTTNATGSAARFAYPYGVAVDTSGNVYVADHDNHAIRKITSAGVTTTLAGTVGVSGLTNATGTAARFKGPSGVAVDASGNVFVTDTDNDVIRKITSAGVVTTFATGFDDPLGITIDASGNLYVADTLNHVIKKVTAAGVVSVFAGTNGVSGSANGTGTAASFNRPYAIAIDTTGNLYVADYGNFTIRKITSAGVVTTIAGTAGVSGFANGVGGAAKFNQTNGIAVNANGTIYVSDTYNRSIRVITGTTVTTMTGAGTRFYYPQGLAIDSANNIYIADGDNQMITKASFIPDAPVNGSSIGSDQSIQVGQSATFTVGAPALSTTYQWEVSTNGGGAYSSVANGAQYSGATTSTLTITPATVALSGTKYRVKITNTSGTGTSGSATLTVNPAAPGGGSSVPNQSIAVGGNAAFSIGTAVGGESYQWEVSLDGTTWTTVTNAGVYSGATTTTLTITGATAALNGNKYRAKITNISGSAFSGSGTLTVTGTSGVVTARLVNLSIRSNVGVGADGVFIGLGTSGTGSKNIIIRGAGPSLVNHGIATGFLANPTITLYNSSGTAQIDTNTRWGTASNASTMAATFTSVGAFDFANGSNDSAIVRSLANGTYSAQISGVNNTTGIALAEFYDGDGGTYTARLTNASARAKVGTGADVLTAGFVIAGNGTVKVLIRGVGPGLIPHGITTGYVATPSITVYKDTTPIASNTGWSGSAEMMAAFNSVGAFGLATADCALILDLSAGNYSVQLSGVGNTTGIGLVEVYEIHN